MLNKVDKLSKAAREKYEQLQAQIQTLVTNDQNREPKLTESEKVEIKNFEARIDHLKPVMAMLEKYVPEMTARRDYLKIHAPLLILEGESADTLADEFVHLTQVLDFSEEAWMVASREIGTATGKIISIKKHARERELREAE